MQIYSWNMLYRNTRPDDAFAYIQNTPFDIFCLQEVPESFLARLKTLPYHLAFQSDVERFIARDQVRNYVVTLSKYPITRESNIPYPDYWPKLPKRTKLFVDLAPSRFFTRIRNRNGLATDITLPQGPVRVFNLHLILAHPVWRLREFDQAMAARDHTMPTIVCGDFNILEKPHITPLNWLLGGRVSDALLYERERLHIEKRFAEYELTNALRHSITHPLSLSQLDHILVSHSFSIEQAEVVADRHGSDHHPIHVTIA